MAYNHITNRDAKQFTRGRGQYGFQHLYIIHHWGDPNTNPTAEGIVNYFATTAPTSAHLVLTGTGRKVYQMVNDADTAYHAGDWAVNCKSIGIECDPRARDEDYDVLAEVLADFWLHYKVEPILMGHREIVPTACPGRYDINKVDRLMKQKYQEKTNPKPKPTPPPAPAPKPKPEWKPMDEPRGMVAKEDLFVRNLDNMTNQGNVITRGTKIEFNTKADFNGVLYLRSVYATEKGFNWGIDIKKLEDLPKPEVPVDPDNDVDIKEPEGPEIVPQPEPGDTDGSQDGSQDTEPEKPTPTPIEPETPAGDENGANNDNIKDDNMATLTPEQKEELNQDMERIEGTIINLNTINPLGTKLMLALVGIGDLALIMSATILAYAMAANAYDLVPIATALGAFGGAFLQALGYYRKGKNKEIEEITTEE